MTASFASSGTAGPAFGRAAADRALRDAPDVVRREMSGAVLDRHLVYGAARRFRRGAIPRTSDPRQLDHGSRGNRGLLLLMVAARQRGPQDDAVAAAVTIVGPAPLGFGLLLA